ncbi:unnamed protein product [Tenebrio molitor]|nr:unnamed protein product [Tenebrio molitor]
MHFTEIVISQATDDYSSKQSKFQSLIIEMNNSRTTS